MQDLEIAKQFQDAKKKILTEIRKVVVGQDNVIENLLISLSHFLIIFFSEVLITIETPILPCLKKG